MNFLRGILSIGIIIACMLNWVDIDVDIMMLSLSGLKWTSSTILLYASIFSAGYAFYNSYNDSNRNAWIYLITGLYGSGVSIYIFLSMTGFFDYIYTVIPSRETDVLTFDFGLGIYLTGLFSFLLFLTGFNKSENKASITTYSNQEQTVLGQEKFKKPNLEEWKKNNPGKTINDYYSENIN